MCTSKVTEYEELIIAVNTRKLQLQFLQDCLEEQVIPRSLRPAIFRQTNSPFPDSAKYTLKDSIQQAKRDIENLYYRLRLSIRTLKQQLPQDLLQVLMETASNKCEKETHHIEIKTSLPPSTRPHPTFRQLERCIRWSDSVQSSFVKDIHLYLQFHHDDFTALTHAQEGQVRPRPASTETGELQDEQPLPPPVPSLTSDRFTTRQSPQVQTQTRQSPDQLRRESEGTHWTPESPRSEDPISLRFGGDEEELEDELNETPEHRTFHDHNYDPYHGTWPVAVERRVLLWLIVAFLIIVTIVILVLLVIIFRLKMALACLVQKICCNKTLCCN
ncbi:hypothetical protein Pmani_018679 [Petrolisthes manimaculis]|uniref:Uncharacterized protein n=1 Tax=Petrolisthes manimaculis TaxID=1843537 RepID=A0AAE1U6G0_9EUCA|nr:hypothetical protein Pmani_018679 [Petrolisthes manimaculis]